MARLTLLLSAFVAAALAAPFSHRQDLPIVARDYVTDDADIFGNFKLGISDPDKCPRKLSISQTENGEEDISHSAFSVNGVNCSGDNYMKVVKTLKEVRSSGKYSKDTKTFLTQLENDADLKAIFGIHQNGLTCGGFEYFAPNTVTVLITVTENIEFIGLGSYAPDKRHLINIDDNRTCSFFADLRPLPTTPEPEPTEEPTDPTKPVKPPSTDPTATATATPSPSVAVAATVTTTPPTVTDTVVPATIEPAESMEVSMSPSVEGDDEDDDGSVCFPADAKVTLADGSVKSMSSVQIGDRVLVSSGVFSEVYMFTHKQKSTVHQFVSLATSSGAVLEATKSHYIYINGRFAAMSTARVGDVLELSNGARTSVVSVSRVTKTGLYNPQTVHGDIMVNSIRASTFTRTVEPAAAQALLMPIRFAYAAFGWTTSAFNNGADNLAALLPRGQTAL